MKLFTYASLFLIGALYLITTLYAGERIFDIVAQGDLDAFNRVKSRITSFNIKDENEIPLLIIAVKGLIDYKRSIAGTTALHIAAKNNDVPTLKVLLARGALLTIWDEKGRTPYRVALQAKASEAARLIYSASLTVAVLEPVEEKYLTIIDAILKSGVSANTLSSDGKSLLMYAVESDSSAGVKLILEHGADLEYRQAPYSSTALHLAAARSNPAIVHQLTVGNADISAIIRNDTYKPDPVHNTTSSETIRYKTPSHYNFKLNIFSSKSSSSSDRRCYYKVYINKVEVGRTETGLESQNKTYTTMLDINRHLVGVVKYILDEKKEKYVKLNNIYQPNPGAFYIDIKEERITILSIEHKKDDKTVYLSDFEKE